MADNYIARTPKDDPRDKIQVEIGDSRDASAFHPQAKIMRWDNEVNFSARLVHGEKDPVIVDGNVITWDGEELSAKFYDTTDNEGGYEFEVVIAKKPASNKIKFTLQTKGLDFFYQPPLYDEIKIGDEGGRVVLVTDQDAYDKDGNVLIHRDANIVGSYAVYASERKDNLKGEKLYRAGKVGHIYRPKVTDANGNSAWEDLEINGNNLTITIPQTFLDSAVFPIVSRGVNFGYETAGATVSAHYDDQRVCWATPSSGGTGVSMALSSRVSTGTATGVMGLYVHSTGALVANSQTDRHSYTSTTKAWNTDNFGATKPTIVSGTQYWLSTYGGENSTNYIYIYWDAGDAGKGGTIDPVAYTGTENLPATVSPSAQSRIYSIYATYNVVHTLAIANAAQPQAVGNVSLTIAKTLAIANVAQPQAAGNVVLTIAKTLAIANAAQAQSAGNVSLAVAKTLAINGAAQAQSAENVTLIENIPLAIQDALTGQTAGNVVLEVAKTLAIDAIAQAQSVESPALVINFTLAIQNAAQSQTAENATLVQDYLLSIQAIAQPQSAENVSLETAGGLAIANALQAQTVENVVLVQDFSLTIQNAMTGQSVENVILIENKTLVIQDAATGQSVENVGLTVAKTLAIDNPLQAQAAENVILVQNTALVIDNALQSQSAGSFALVQNCTLSPQNISQPQTVENVSISAGEITLTIQNAAQAQTVSNAVLILAIVRAWTLHSRSTAWTVESRSPTWTLKDRAQAWTLDTRTNTWTLSARSTAWALEEDDR